MFFGKYLLENGIVTSEQLVDAIIIQMESLPTLVKIIKKNKFLSHNEIIDLVDQSVNEKKSILEIITQMEMLSKEKMDKLMEQRWSSGRGLCEVLVDKGHVSSMMLNEYVGRYLAHNGTEHRSGDEGVLSFDVTGEFVKIFDKDFLDCLKKEIHKISSKGREQHVFNVGKDMALLATVSGMGKLDAIVDMVKIWLDVLEISKDVSDKNHWIEVSSGLKNMLELIWDGRERIAREGSMENLLQEKKWRERHRDGIRRAEYLLKDYQNKKAA